MAGLQELQRDRIPAAAWKAREGETVKDPECPVKDLGLVPVGNSELLKDFREKSYHQKWV